MYEPCWYRLWNLLYKIARSTRGRTLWTNTSSKVLSEKKFSRDNFKKINMGRQYLKEVTDLPVLKSAPNVDVPAIVKEVIESIRNDGGAAVRKYSEKFDKWSPANFKLSQADIDAAIANCPKQTLDDIKEVQQNVRAFAEAQKNSLKDFEIEIRPGVHLGQKNVPIDNVGA